VPCSACATAPPCLPVAPVMRMVLSLVMAEILLLNLTAVKVGANNLDVNIIDDVYFLKIQILYGPRY